MVHKVYDDEYYKITVEEKFDNSFIVTFWDKKTCLENDREVFCFETFGGAMDKAWDFLVSLLGHYGEYGYGQQS